MVTKEFLFFSVIFIGNIKLFHHKNQTAKINKNFDDSQRALILNANSNTPMRVFKINNVQDSLLLRRQSEDVVIIPNDTTLKHFTNRLFATVRDSLSLGVGIAAPQVGILKILFGCNVLIKKNFLLKCTSTRKLFNILKKANPRRRLLVYS